MGAQKSLVDDFIGGSSRRGDSYMDFSGGRVFGDLGASQAGIVDWSGGVVFGAVNANHFGVVNIFGWGFELNGVRVPLGPMAFQPGTRPRLTGTLSSGETIDNNLFRGDATAAIILIPEPATTCNDVVDNDGDDLIDLDDPDCTDAYDLLEAPDADEDLVADSLDNCLAISNTGQEDTDADDIGNACDCDFDQNGSCNISDFNIFLPDFPSGNGQRRRHRHGRGWGVWGSMTSTCFCPALLPESRGRRGWCPANSSSTFPIPIYAHFADRERLFRSIVIGRFGDRERSGATPVSLCL